jgi:hypothetical protein
MVVYWESGTACRVDCVLDRAFGRHILFDVSIDNGPLFPERYRVEVGPNRLSCRSLSTKAASQMGRSGQIFDPLRPDLKENLWSVEPIYSLNLACIFRCMRCSMTQQIRSVASAVCIAALLPIGMSTAHAKPKQCSVAVPSNPQGHWSYRFIDGRKCWYEGNNMLSRSLLQWPASAPTQSASDEGATSVLTVKPGNLLESQAWVPDDSDSFEERWRAIRN